MGLGLGSGSGLGLGFGFGLGCGCGIGSSWRVRLGEVRARDDGGACREEVAGRRARTHAERLARGAERNGGELAAISDLGDGGEREGLDHLRSK